MITMLASRRDRRLFPPWPDRPDLARVRRGWQREVPHDSGDEGGDWM